jgi:hypothetical protein
MMTSPVLRTITSMSSARAWEILVNGEGARQGRAETVRALECPAQARRLIERNESEWEVRCEREFVLRVRAGRKGDPLADERVCCTGGPGITPAFFHECILIHEIQYNLIYELILFNSGGRRRGPGPGGDS